MANAIISSLVAGSIPGFVAFNPLLTDLTKYDEAVDLGRVEAVKVHPSDLLLVAAPAGISIPTGATGVGVSQIQLAANFPDEVRQFIVQCQFGWGAALGANRRIAHWTAAVLVRDMLTAYVNQGAPR